MVVEHFLDEARLASRLTHPNIVQIDDLGRAGEEYFIAMELVDGADLGRLLEVCRGRGLQVPLRVALAVLRKICDGLHAAHTALGADGKPLELVHRDVKSANVFVAKNGVVKVGDFGIAKAVLPSRVHKTEVGVVKGTAAYMAPEHRLGEEIDRRADLYAVGAIAYEMLSGQPVNLDLVQLLAKGREGWPHLSRLVEVRPDVPAALDAIVFRCLAYDRDERFPDCAALEEALEQVANAAGQVAGEKQVAQWVEQVLAAEGAGAVGARA
jgi:serine/threonine-protein kinase